MTSVLSGLISGVALSLIAVSCHRIVLLGETSLPSTWGLYWSTRELGYIGRAFVLGFLSRLPTILAGAILFFLSRRPLLSEISLVTWLAVAYPISRLSLVLPAMAIDQRVTFAESWQLSSGNGWRLAVVLLAAPLTLWGLGAALGSIGAHDHVAWVGARSFIFCALGVFEVVSLSVSFRVLRASSA
jgi:hypothetical protein